MTPEAKFAHDIVMDLIEMQRAADKARRIHDIDQSIKMSAHMGDLANSIYQRLPWTCPEQIRLQTSTQRSINTRTAR